MRGNKVTVESKNRLEWDQYFMGIAQLSAMRSKDPAKKVGACLVNKRKRIVGTGYNGFPDKKLRRNKDNDEVFPWEKGSDNLADTKHAYVIHAEENACINATTSDLNDATMYVTYFPCNNCAKTMIQHGIKEVVYLEGRSTKAKHKGMYEATDNLFAAFGIKSRQISPLFNVEVNIGEDLTPADLLFEKLGYTKINENEYDHETEPTIIIQEEGYVFKECLPDPYKELTRLEMSHALLRAISKRYAELFENN